MKTDFTHLVTGLGIRPNQSPNPLIFFFGFLSIPIAIPQVLELATEILDLISTYIHAYFVFVKLYFHQFTILQFFLYCLMAKVV